MGRLVLVVDDDPMIRDLLEIALTREGFDVATAADGLEALEQVDRQPPGLILLDLMMPRMNGVAFAEELGRRGLRPGIPILVLTAAGPAERDAGQIGAEGYLPKPFPLPTLLEQVGRLATA